MRPRPATLGLDLKPCSVGLFQFGSILKRKGYEDVTQSVGVLLLREIELVRAAVHLMFGRPAARSGGRPRSALKKASCRADDGVRRAEKALPNPTRAAPLSTYSTPQLGEGSI